VVASASQFAFLYTRRTVVRVDVSAPMLTYTTLARPLVSEEESNGGGAYFDAATDNLWLLGGYGRAHGSTVVQIANATVTSGGAAELFRRVGSYTTWAPAFLDTAVATAGSVALPGYLLLGTQDRRVMFVTLDTARSAAVRQLPRPRTTAAATRAPRTTVDPSLPLRNTLSPSVAGGPTPSPPTDPPLNDAEKELAAFYLPAANDTVRPGLFGDSGAVHPAVTASLLVAATMIFLLIFHGLLKKYGLGGSGAQGAQPVVAATSRAGVTGTTTNPSPLEEMLKTRPIYDAKLHAFNPRASYYTGPGAKKPSTEPIPNDSDVFDFDDL
jgi:hypothetical protein